MQLLERRRLQRRLSGGIKVDMAKVIIGNKWDELLSEEWEKPYYKELRQFLIDEYRNETVYPEAGNIYNALKFTDYDDVKVVILGQDPYHEPGQAQGLSFSVPLGTTLPPSLVNILKELENDLGIVPGAGADAACRPSDMQGQGILEPWARQGVLLLNTVLTVRAHQAASHKGRGWEQFTDRVIELLAARTKPMVFVLWGANAQTKKSIILQAQNSTGNDVQAKDVQQRHLIIEAPHPSPLSAYRGFFGGCYFSRCNFFLEDNGIPPIDWCI